MTLTGADTISLHDDRGLAAPPRRPRWGRLLACLLAIASVAGSTTWWFHTGTFLRSASAGYGSMAPTGTEFSFGIYLTTTGGGSVTLDHASANALPGATVTWAVYRAEPGAIGFGAWRGPLEPEWNISPVNGYRVDQPAHHPERGGTWLIASIKANQPGVYHLTDVTITYQSGPRTRRVNSNADACVLAYAPGDEQRITQERRSREDLGTDDSAAHPLLLELERCENPDFGI